MAESNGWHFCIEDFGPLTRAEFDVRPFTVFVGPNGSGKTYAASAALTVFEALHAAGQGLSLNLVDRLAAMLGATAASAPAESTRTAPSNAEWAATWPKAQERATGLLQGLWVDLLERTYGHADLGGLSRHSSVPGCQWRVRSQGSGVSWCSTWHGPTQLGASHVGQRLSGFEAVWNALQVSDDDRLALAEDMQLSATMAAMRSAAYETAFLPAARSGLLQAHRQLTAAVIEQATYAGTRDYAVPAMRKPVADFLRRLLDVGVAEPGELAALAETGEDQVLGGAVNVSPERVGFGSIRWSSDDVEVPIDQAPSGIQELAPLILFVRHFLKPGTLLILEEPEAHLHPAMQRRLAGFLAQLCRAGVRVMVTTHSDTFLTECSHLVLASGLSERKRKSLGFAKDEWLAPHEVGAYRFEADPAGGGYRTVELAVDEEEGIDETEFLQVTRDLYDQSIELRKALAAARRRHAKPA